MHGKSLVGTHASLDAAQNESPPTLHSRPEHTPPVGEEERLEEMFVFGEEELVVSSMQVRQGKSEVRAQDWPKVVAQKMLPPALHSVPSHCPPTGGWEDWEAPFPPAQAMEHWFAVAYPMPSFAAQAAGVLSAQVDPPQEGTQHQTLDVDDAERLEERDEPEEGRREEDGRDEDLPDDAREEIMGLSVH